MTLARSWIRPLLGASAGALLAPLALLVSVLLLGVGGGLSGLQSLGQLLNGPAAPPTVRVALLTPRRVDLAPRERPAPVAASTAAATRRVATGRPAVGGTVTHTLATVPVPGGPVAGSAPPRELARPVSSPSGPATSPAVPQPQPTPVDQLAQTGQAVAQQLPAPVGPAAGQAISTVATTVDHLLPPGSSSSGSGTSLPRLP